ncbi:MAG: glycosyltransferase family 2 protein [Chloroflexota bacterium]
MQLKAPVILFIFKRPEQTSRVFDAIAKARPQKLYVVADGPRAPDEEEVCQLTRQIIENIGWECEVNRNYSDTNLGLRNRVISGLDWVFDHEERAIILEDDCLPRLSFFQYCEELLNYYNDDEKVLHISGDNFLFGKKSFKESYYFSKYPHVWGWATWRRAWALFHEWNCHNPPLDPSIFQSCSEGDFWQEILQEVQANKLNYSWAYQWSLVCLAFRAINIVPNVNLVSNIGFGEIATNTKEMSNLANIQVGEMHFPLIHPEKRAWNNAADEQVAKLFFRATTTSSLAKLKSILKSLRFS